MEVKKRNGELQEFDKNKIILAIDKARKQSAEEFVGNVGLEIANDITDVIREEKVILSIEDISDIVEIKLMEYGYGKTAKQYILYRAEQDRNRVDDSDKLLTNSFISKYKKLPNPMDIYGAFTYYRTYSRFLEKEQRREYWYETVRRAVEYNCTLIEGVTRKEAEELFDNIFYTRQFLSGRTLWIGGTPIANLYGTSNYNCAFTIIDDFIKFKELFYLLMIGAGVGFRVLKEDIVNLPEIRSDVQVVHKLYALVPKENRKEHTSLIFNGSIVTIEIGDSKEGWTQGLEYYFKILTEIEYHSIDTIVFNYNSIRPQGERLKRFGGTASGHKSLRNMFNKIDLVFKKNTNGEKIKLTSLNCIDICNIIGENVVIGGVRRTSEVGLIGVDDMESAQAKNNLYLPKEGSDLLNINEEISHRSMSNNSIIYFEKPSREKLKWHMQQLEKSGEPGFMNMEAARKRREDCQGGNPCMEILLPDRGLCNLVTNNVHGFVEDNELNRIGLFKAMKLSVRAAIRMTCLKLELFKWNQVQERDRLIGCSLTGWRDAIDTLEYTKEQESYLFMDLRDYAHKIAKDYSMELNIPKPLLVTTIKPEGTLSLLAGVSNGLHYGHAQYYIRRIRINAHDPLVKIFEELKYPIFAENDQDLDTCTTKVVEFPVKSTSPITKFDVTAIQQLENYLMAMRNYVDHNASITVTVRNHEWEEVTDWVWDNWDEIVGISFLSLDDNFYPLAPFEAITEKEYISRKKDVQPFDQSLLAKYEGNLDEVDVDSNDCPTGACPVK
jgi:adenosylcobalamin-dependent ribonucleoside-triphosphate reductase